MNSISYEFILVSLKNLEGFFKFCLYGLRDLRGWISFWLSDNVGFMLHFNPGCGISAALGPASPS